LYFRISHQTNFSVECISGEYSSLRRLVEKIKECSFFNSGLKSNLHYSKKLPPSSSHIELVESPNVGQRIQDIQSKLIRVSGEEQMNQKPQRPDMKRTQSENIDETLINKLKDFVKEKKKKDVKQNKPSLPESPKPRARSMANIPVVSSKEAEKLIKDFPKGTWMLRLNEKGEKRITMSTDNAKHIKLYEFPGGLFSLKQNSDDKEPLQTLLKNLQESGTLGKEYKK
jgi:hypothetical protein